MSGQKHSTASRPAPEHLSSHQREKILTRILYQAACGIKRQMEVELGYEGTSIRGAERIDILGHLIYQTARTVKSEMERYLGCGTGRRL